MRVTIFVDFWNLQLAWRDYHRITCGTDDIVKIPWKDKFPKVLIRAVDPAAVYAGTHVYASINRKSTRDRSLNSFLQIMDTFPGYKVVVKERKPAKKMYCTHEGCRKEISICPHCNNTIIRTVEKGVDTSIAIELFHYAIEDVYDKAILISDDADFVPAVEFIQRTGKQIIHAGFKGQAFSMKKACWDHIDFEDIMDDLLAP